VFERSEFCIFSEKEENNQGLAVASHTTARRGFLVTFVPVQKSNKSMVIKT
jgi:hypothetical protein